MKPAEHEQELSKVLIATYLISVWASLVTYTRKTIINLIPDIVQHMHANWFTSFSNATEWTLISKYYVLISVTSSILFFYNKNNVSEIVSVPVFRCGET
jgi:hypothetical protein